MNKSDLDELQEALLALMDAGLTCLCAEHDNNVILAFNKAQAILNDLLIVETLTEKRVLRRERMNITFEEIPCPQYGVRYNILDENQRIVGAVKRGIVLDEWTGVLDNGYAVVSYSHPFRSNVFENMKESMNEH